MVDPSLADRVMPWSATPSAEPRALWRLRLSPLDCGHAALYVRTSPTGEPLGGELELVAGEVAEFDTYFNAFGVGKWLRHTTVRDVSLMVQARGDLRLEIVHAVLGRRPEVIAVCDVARAGASTHRLELPPLDTLGGGSAFLRATCLSGESTISAGAWCTSDDPNRCARVGLVIVAFNRPGDVRANLSRLAAEFAKDPDLAQRIAVVVVDNGRTLAPGSVDGMPVTVLANPNVGGAGGFARGLMHLRERAEVTHALFMDDDVVLDPEVVLRTIDVLSYATDPGLCVAGAMLDRDAPTRLFEAGARYLGTALDPNRAIGQDLDLEDPRCLLLAEREEEPIDYGAWWFFAFPLDLTRDNPLPTFVRGDDVCWGLLHAGRTTVTFNGIGIWHDGFEHKNGPVAWFYETRNFALANVLAVPGYRWWHLLLRYVNLCGRSLVSLKYASAANITFGMQEFLRGPQHWLNLDQEELNERVHAFDGEHVVLLPPELRAVPDMRVRRGLGRYTAALVSLALLGGHLLPESFDRKPIRSVPIQQRVLGAAPGHSRILYRDASRRSGFVATRDRPLFFVLLRDMLRTAVKIPRSFGSLRRAYVAAYPEMVSDAYWRDQFAAPIDEARSTSSPDRLGARGRPTRRLA